MLLSTQTATMTTIGNNLVLFSLAAAAAALLSTTSSTSSIVLLDLLVIGSQLRATCSDADDVIVLVLFCPLRFESLS